MMVPSRDTSYIALWRRVTNYYDLEFEVNPVTGANTGLVNCIERSLPARELIAPRIDEVEKLKQNLLHCPLLLRALTHGDEEYERVKRALGYVEHDYVVVHAEVDAPWEPSNEAIVCLTDIDE